jgi:Trypsin-like peptidase domain
VIGNPNGLQGTVSDGLIAAFREDRSLIQITAPISPGSSGSPVLDETGQVIGVATLMEVDGQNLNFAIPVESVKDAIASAIAQQGEGGVGKQQPAPSPREPVSLSPRAGGSELNEFVREFVTAGNYDDPSVELGFYGESVDYFDDGRVGKAFIAEDIKKYNSRWPARSYSVEGDPTVTVDSARDMAKAVVVLHFSVQNNRKSIRGSCQNTILIRDVSTNPKVVSVVSKMLTRTEEATRQ